MIQCQNCGQLNNFGSNFCRFCGTKMVVNNPAARHNSPPPLPPPPKPYLQQQQQHAPPPMLQQQQPQSYEYRPPRPYIWKTDEFLLPSENGERKTGQINQVQPLANLMPPQSPAALNQQRAQAPMPVYQQPGALSYGNYRCPHCGTQNFPYLSRKISTAGWIVFAVLLITFFPLFWIGFLIKEDVKICSVCNYRVG